MGPPQAPAGLFDCATVLGYRSFASLVPRSPRDRVCAGATRRKVETRNHHGDRRYCPSALTIEPCWQASAIATCAVRLEHSVRCMICSRNWL